MICNQQRINMYANFGLTRTMSQSKISEAAFSCIVRLAKTSQAATFRIGGPQIFGQQATRKMPDSLCSAFRNQVQLDHALYTLPAIFLRRCKRLPFWVGVWVKRSKLELPLTHLNGHTARTHASTLRHARRRKQG